jgi:hypothetical protein
LPRDRVNHTEARAGRWRGLFSKQKQSDLCLTLVVHSTFATFSSTFARDILKKFGLSSVSALQSANVRRPTAASTRPKTTTANAIAITSNTWSNTHISLTGRPKRRARNPLDGSGQTATSKADLTKTIASAEFQHFAFGSSKQQVVAGG